MWLVSHEESFETEATSHSEMAYYIHSIYQSKNMQWSNHSLKGINLTTARKWIKMSGNKMNVLTAHSFGI